HPGHRHCAVLQRAGGVMASVVLSLDSEIESRPAMLKLVEKARSMLAKAPDLLSPLPDGTLEMRAPLPAGYKPSMNWDAEELRARLTKHGHLFEISEESYGHSGGWIGSCIPPSLYGKFLSAWLASAKPRQMELFA